MTARPLSPEEYAKVEQFGLHRAPSRVRRIVDDVRGMRAGVIAMGLVVVSLVVLGGAAVLAAVLRIRG